MTKNTQDLATPETRLMMDELYRKSQTCTEPPAKFQTWMLCKNGEKRCMYGQINSVRHGDTVSTYFTMTDVTAFAQREQELLDRIASLEKSSKGDPQLPRNQKPGKKQAAAEQ